MQNKTRVLVTGATGFIGRKLCLALAENGYHVHALCRTVDHPHLINHKNIIPYRGDILKQETLINAIKGCSQVYHTAALAKMWCKNEDLFYQVNVIGTKNVLEACIAYRIKKVVYTSTCGVLGPTIKSPLTETGPRIQGFPIAYERTKFLAELVVKEYVNKGLPIVIVNPSRVFGEGPITDSNTVSKMISGYIQGKWRIIPGNGENIANYAYLDDVIHGHLNAMKYGISGERYILGGEDISFNTFFETVQQLADQHRKMFRVSHKLIKFYSYLQWFKTKLTGLDPVFLPAFADRLKYDQKYSSKKAVVQLNYHITPFKEGIEKTINYLSTQNR